MNRITLIIAAFVVALLAICTSCKKGGGGSDSSSDAKYLTSSSFVSTFWEGATSNGQRATLQVSTESLMVYTYFEKKSLAKNTDELVKKVVNITYDFNEGEGTFTGTGKEDSFAYSGSLSSTTQMRFNMQGESLTLTKK